MSRDAPLAVRLRIAALVFVDAAVYALVAAAVTAVLAFVLGVATGGGFVRMKALLFLAGFGLMAYSTVRLWPSSPEDLDEDTMSGVSPPGGSIPAATNETRFQTFVRGLPPLRWIRPPPPDRRLSSAGKLFWSSVAILLLSYLMEAVFGVV
ncbi:DUF7555 family protein [Natronomonas amylolytica]|uniref:DUF7555 family protein n=1 Tax=Natronomonas amylolytica TaxID=3108498 RepID=UPI0030085B84